MISLINILKKVLKEAEEVDQDKPEDIPSNLEEMLARFQILKPVLQDLLTSGNDVSDEDLNNIVANIEVAVYKPTTFKVVFKNGSEMMLKYDPTPAQINKKDNYKAKDYFQCLIAGKKYSLQNRSQFLQALDYIGDALKTGPIGKGNNQSSGGANSTSPDEEEPVTDEEP